MKRFAFSIVLLVSAFACSGSPEAEVPTKKLQRSETIATGTGTTTATSTGEVIELSEDESDAADDLVHTVPTGAFADVSSFCAAQTKLVAAKIVEANAAYKVDGYGDMNLEPKCEETEAVLEGAKVALAAPFTAVKAVTFETGYSTESYLLVQKSDGWTAVRAALLYVNHNDPGCGSIERPSEILEVYVEQGALVVKTSAGRTWLSKKDEAGDLSLTYVRACRSTAAGVSCGTPEVVDAKVVLGDEDQPDEPVQTRFFSTTYTVGHGVAIEPATRFDESEL